MEALAVSSCHGLTGAECTLSGVADTLLGPWQSHMAYHGGRWPHRAVEESHIHTAIRTEARAAMAARTQSAGVEASMNGRHQKYPGSLQVARLEGEQAHSDRTAPAICRLAHLQSPWPADLQPRALFAAKEVT